MKVLLALLALLCSGCLFTTLGVELPSQRAEVRYGPDKTLPLCVYASPDVSQSRADELLDGWNAGPAHDYGLYVRDAAFETRERQAFTMEGETADVPEPMPSVCDASIYFVSMRAEDWAYTAGAVMVGVPENFAAAEGNRAVVSVSWHSPTQALGLWPARITRHEIYHLLGCEHDITMSACYLQIQRFKETHTL